MDDPLDIEKARVAKMEHQHREEERLARLKKMESEAGNIMDARKARREAFELSRTNGDDFKKRQDEVLKRMVDAKQQRKLEKKRLREESGAGKAKRKEDKKKKETEVSSSSSSEDSSSSASSSSGSEAKKRRKSEPEAEDIAELPLDPESIKKAQEARAREREVKRKAAQQAAAWAAEAKRKEAEMEAQRQAEVKRKAEEAEQRKNAEAKRKLEEEEAKKKEEEATAKQKAADLEARRQLFKTDATRKAGDSRRGGAAEKGDLMIGGFLQGQTVYAAKNITVKGTLVVKLNTQGRIIGPSETNPMQRIAVQFSRREDRLQGNMNVVPSEIKKTLR